MVVFGIDGPTKGLTPAARIVKTLLRSTATKTNEEFTGSVCAPSGSNTPMQIAEWYFAQARNVPKSVRMTEGKYHSRFASKKVAQEARKVPCGPPLLYMSKGCQACLRRQGGPARMLTMQRPITRQGRRGSAFFLCPGLSRNTAILGRLLSNPNACRAPMHWNGSADFILTNRKVIRLLFLDSDRIQVTTLQFEAWWSRVGNRIKHLPIFLDGKIHVPFLDHPVVGAD
jgi:hypothetical protein